MYHTCRLMCMGSLFGRVGYFDCTFFPHSPIFCQLFFPEVTFYVFVIFREEPIFLG